MLPADVPHAALLPSSYYLHGQVFHVKGRARNPTTRGPELSALMKPLKAIVTVLTCYKEGPQDLDRRIRAIYADYIVCTISSEKIALRQAHTELYISKVIEVLKANRKFNGYAGNVDIRDWNHIPAWTVGPCTITVVDF